MREKRPRIKRAEGAVKVEDELEYKPNRCTQRAREIERVPSKILNHLWYDQHYIGRNSVGEDDGTPRDGIDSDTVKATVCIAFNHLMHYSSTLDKFYFANYELNGKIARRILVQNSHTSNPVLNVITETHFVDFNKYETTVITAMCKNGFIPNDGQFVVEILGEFESILKQYVKGSYKEIAHCQT
jgi:hypothetical protein